MDRKLRVGVPLTGLAILFALSTVVAQRSGAAPDGLQPPAGPVSDTQPSLTTISEQISQLQSGSQVFPDGLEYYHEGVNEKTVEFVPASDAASIRIYAVIIEGAGSSLLVGANEDIVGIFGGDSLNQNGQLVGTNHLDFGGLRVPTPVKFRNLGSPGNSSLITLLYWVDE